VKRSFVRGLAAAVFAAALLTGCGGEKSAQQTATAAADHSKMPGMGAMSLPVTIPKGAIYTEADVRFMQGMIAHHGQAIYMSRLAASRGASPRLLKFATKIDQSQIAEIVLMQDWLRANGQAVPDSASYHHTQMPGMLTAEQLARLNAASGADFERAFLELMIQHHMGALKMVDDLHAAPLSAQDVDVSVFANDVVSVQTAEIEAMQQMLSEL
jgi:uncharacterized protein (DUF305 family)